MNAERLTPEHSGVYAVPEAPGEIRDAALGRAFAWLDADLSGVGDKAALTRAIADALAAPKTFGGNWDALADALQDLSWRAAPGYVLLIRGGAGVAPADRKVLIDILRESAEFWRAHAKCFVALIEGASELPRWK